MADFDLHIKGGTVVDGTRVPRYRADVWIKDGKIAQIGGRSPGFAKKTIDAGGMIVAPGLVDLHTHYDAQIRWDPYCSISGWHGATSVVLGNCGFAHDFPGGEWRRVQHARGYRAIIVNGEMTWDDGQCTGATPGRLLRGGRG